MGNIVLHIGSDKAGSSALQTFLFKNSDSLKKVGVHYARAGLNGSDHHGYLMLSEEDSVWDGAREELSTISNDEMVVFSWEGVHFFNEAKLSRIRDSFRGHVVNVIYIAREQAELENSGTLQRVKQFNLPFDIRDSGDFVSTNKFAWMARDVLRSLNRYSAVFGKSNVSAFTYHPTNIIRDIMSGLGVDDISGYDFSGFNNPSLTFEAAIAQQRLANIYADPEKRKMIAKSIIASIDDLGGTRNIFPSKSVSKIRNMFHDTNATVAENWFGRETLFDLRDIANDDGYDFALVQSYFERGLSAVE